MTLTPSEQAISDALDRSGWRAPTLMKRGGVGLVFRTSHPRTARQVVIKCLQPRFANKPIDLEGTKTFGELFQREVEALAALEHRCLMDIIDCGTIALDEGPLPYYVMPYLSGAKDLYEYVTARDWGPQAHSTFTSWLLSALGDALDAISMMHGATWLHRDLKGDNILVDSHGNIRLMDFGSAWSWSTSLEGTTVGLSDQGYLHPELFQYLKNIEDGSAVKRAFTNVPRALLESRGRVFDLFALGETLRRLRDDYLPPRGISFSLLNSLVVRLKSTSKDPQYSYADAGQVAHDLERLDPSVALGYLVPEVRSTTTDSIRIVPMTSVSVTRDVLALIDTTLFQRLRGVRQLGFISSIYPSATHSRFEHSLGAYGWAQRYLAALWEAPDQHLRRDIPQECLTATLLATLLHDLGQYTFAHAAEGVSPALGHETLGLELLAPSDVFAANVSPVVLDQVGELQTVIERRFGKDIQRLTIELLTHYGAPQAMPVGTKGLLRSVFDGPIDVDKMDYLRRDGVHTGIGDWLSGVEDRFLPALTISLGKDALAVLPSGRDAAERMIDQRYRLFRWVYWHRGSRAVEALVAEVIDLMIATRGTDAVVAFFHRHALVSNDHDMMAHLRAACLSWGLDPSYEAALTAIYSRHLPHRVLTIGPRPDGRPGSYRHNESLYKALTRMLKEPTSAGFRLKKQQFVEELGERLGLGFAPGDVTIDVPIEGRHNVGHLHIVVDEKKEPLISTVSHVWESIGDDFEALTRRARVFVAKRFEDQVPDDAVEAALMHVFLNTKDKWVDDWEAAHKGV